MISREQLAQYFDQLLEPATFEDYAPNGLQVEGRQSIKKVAFAVSATQDSVQQALQWGADALVVHHGFFWKHQGSRPLTGAWGKRVGLALKHDLNVYAYHLPLDAHMQVGNAVALGARLGLAELAPFALYKRRNLGARGVFPQPLSARDLQTKMQQVLGHDVILASADPLKLVRTVGIITGGANNEWTQALEAGLDAYVTGEISEYNWHDCREAGLHYFAGGHHATERFGIQALMERTSADQSQLACAFFDSPNPA